MSSLNAFLNPVKVENKEVIISNRFQENGKPVPFIIRPIHQKENEQLIKKYTKKDRKTNQETFNRSEYVQALTASAVVFPNLADSELQTVYGLGETETLKNMLLMGEFAELAKAVQELSGLDEDINEDIEEVKNE